MAKTIDGKTIKRMMIKVFRTMKVKDEVFMPVVNGLIETSLRGVDSHGIRLFPHYVKATMLGRLNPSPRFRMHKTSPTTQILDADHTYGITAGVRAMESAIETAKKYGTGIVVAKNSSHFGAAGIYGLMAAKKNMMGFAFTNVESVVVPYGGKKPFLGTNAFCFCAPIHGETPFCLDMATTTISWNKLMMHRKQDKPLEKGWAVDKEGAITTDPHKAVALTHFGGYKGYGIALMIEMMTSMLGGMPFGHDIPHMFPPTPLKRRLGQFFMAVDIARFQPISRYKKNIALLANRLRSIPATEGSDGVMVAGDPEKALYAKRSKAGIPLTEEVVTDFNEIFMTLHIPVQL